MALTLPFVFANIGLHTPASRLDADYSAIANYINLRNPSVGPIGSRPNPGNAGAIYVASDQANTVYFDDGTAWQAASAGGSSFIEFIGIATPAAPASGAGRLYAPSAPSGLRRLRWEDAAAQLPDYGGVLIRGNGNPFKDVVSTVTETSIFSGAPTIKGGTLGTDRMLRITTIGDFLQNAGGNNGATVRIKYGGTTFINYPGSANFFLWGSGAGLRAPWYVQAEIVAGGATNVQVARARCAVLISGQNPLPGVAVLEGGTSGVFLTAMAVHSTGAVDSTADQTFDVTLQPTINSVNMSIRVFAILVELV